MAGTARRVRSGSSWEQTFGSARAVEAGDRVLVAGTTAFSGTVLHGEGDPYEQAKAAFTNALDALAEFGLGADSVVRTRMYLVHARDVDPVGRAHRELFEAVLPAASLFVVSGFVDSRVLVEVELEAYRPAAREDRGAPRP
ncbi:Rid family hydrolase [Streptomyces physcomitrii]|uniref:RidA family protein n=1 Tax=Streptomyces physcomitrii TaxID=2724184 RepID=A0ABX1H003_9ACTN|nr:Rid family hydrolase [Streptomyces physcomitrii]NKI41363.1 RidA family protein [Streptomyces physcomitrii]